MPRRQSFRKRIAYELGEVAVHALGCGAVLLTAMGLETWLERTLGHDALFFDRIPVRYFVQAGEVGALLRLAWYALFRGR